MGFLSVLFRRAEKRKVYSDLLRMDDYLLDDIGVDRADLRQMMSGHRTARSKGIRAHE